MKKQLVRLATIASSLAVLVAGTTAACAAASTTQNEAEAPRVLIVGDSITQGAVGKHTWRYFFAAANPGIDFVGNKRGTFSIYGGDWDYTGANAYAVSGWDSDHAAVWGGSITNSDPDPKLFQLPIDELTATYAPDTIISAWGINDLNSGVSPTALVAAYAGWISAARAERPDVDFVISELAWTWGTGTSSTKAAEFNALLDDLAARMAAPASTIVIARMAEDYTQADTYDGIHPNQAGEEKIARMMTAAYAELAPEPEAVVVEPAPVVEPVAVVERVRTAPQTAPVRPPLVAPRKVRAERAGARVRVQWRGDASRYVVRCGRVSTRTSKSRTTLRSAARSCKVRAVAAGEASQWVKARVRG
jgi:lysophospholipase L1-like esterase